MMGAEAQFLSLICILGVCAPNVFRNINEPVFRWYDFADQYYPRQPIIYKGIDERISYPLRR